MGAINGNRFTLFLLFMLADALSALIVIVVHVRVRHICRLCFDIVWFEQVFIINYTLVGLVALKLSCEWVVDKMAIFPYHFKIFAAPITRNS